jgi:FecR-like protein
VNDVRGVIGTQEPAVLRAGIDVFQNEIIRTGDKSASRVRFEDNTDLAIGAGSEVTLDRFVFDPDPNKSQVALSIARGVARFTTGSLPKSAYKITTPTATIGVRGTIVTITVAADGSTTISVDEGIALVTSNGVTVTVDAGMTTSVTSGLAPTVGEMDFLLSNNLLPAGLPAGVTHGAIFGLVVNPLIPAGIAAALAGVTIELVAGRTHTTSSTPGTGSH